MGAALCIQVFVHDLQHDPVSNNFSYSSAMVAESSLYSCRSASAVFYTPYRSKYHTWSARYYRTRILTSFWWESTRFECQSKNMCYKLRLNLITLYVQRADAFPYLCRHSLKTPPELRECNRYWGYSLSIAAQPLNCRLRRNHLHNTLLRVTMQPTVTRNASHPASVNLHRKPGGKRFWPHRLPQTALEHPEIVEIRASKSK